MAIKVRNKAQLFFGLILPTILPLSVIAIIPRATTAQQIVVENSIIYVDSQVGNDRDRGERNTPLKTITQALKIAKPNTLISLTPGTYNEATGETFPLIIKNNVTLKGVTGAQGHSVIITGGGSFISPTGAEQNVTIAAIKNAGAITGVTVTNPNSRGHGLWIESANPHVSHSTFTRNGNTGLSVNGNSKPIISNNYFHNNGGNGLLIYGTSAPQVTDNLFENTGFGVSLVQNAASTLENNTFKGNRIGMILEGNSQGILVNNTITNSLEYGLVAISQSQVNLGVTNQPGNNTFSGNKKMDIQNITANTISAAGTTINGRVEGKIDFSDNASSTITSEQIIASNKIPQTANFSRLRKNPLPDNNKEQNSSEITATGTPPAAANPPVDNNDTLPPPPPVVSVSPESTTKEFVFSAPESNKEDSQVITTIPVDSNSNALPQSNSIQSSSLNNNIDSNKVNSLSDLLASSPSSSIKYRVLVEANNDNQKAQVKSFYPDAFNTTYQGKSMLQIGAFTERSKAEIASRSLANLGLNSYILD